MQRILPIVLSVIFMSQQVFSQIAGIVFRDYNRNGIRESVAPSVEPLVEGVTIEAYDASNTLISSTVSASDGTYTMPFTGPVRLEFKIPSGLPCLNNLNDFSGAGSYGNNVRFINSSSSNINYAIQGMNEYISTTNPDVFVPVFTDGDPLGFGTAAMSTCFRSHSYTSTGNAIATRTLAASQLGSVWGVAYSKQAKKIFTSAFLKRQVGLGPLGTGGIYMLQPTSTSFTVTNFFDMDAMGFRTRASNIAPAYGNGTSFTINGGGTEATYLGATDPVSGAPIGLGVVGDNGTTGRNLSINSGGDANDPAAFDQVGKVGLGDIDISDDGKFLFVTNLYDRKLYRLELNDANNPTTVITITSYSLPSISVSNGVLRPFGISYYKDKVYLGAVSTGENGGVNIVNGASDLFAYVFELNNPTGIASFNSSPVLTIPLNYTKGSAILNNAAASQWYPWSRNTSDVLTFSGEQTLPTPILSDIAFTERGDMVLNFMDRSGHQYGFQNYKNLTGTDLVSYDIGGDVLIAGKNCSNGTFTIENNGSFNSSGTTFNGGVSNTEGPGGGEFFSGEFYPVWHKETAMGSSTLMPGDNKLLITLMDPINDFSCGNGKFSTINASRSGMLEINNSTLPGSFAKANGLGDIELAGDSAPIEIGNRIWLDANENGIQDPSELGLANVSVELFADFNNDNMPDGASLGMTTTDVEGHYYFNQSNIPDGDPATSGNQAGLKPQSYYIIRISSSDWNVTFGIAELLEKGLTIDNIGGAGQPDWRDNDAVISAGIPQIQFLTGRVGQSDHSLDFGFKNCTADAGLNVFLSCSSPSATIGTLSVVGNNYSWSPATGLSSTNIAQPITSALSSITYTVSVTSSQTGCAKTSTVLASVNKTPPSANAGTSPSLTCTTPSATIGTSSVAGNIYSWLPSTALSSTSISNPTTSATTSTTYTVTVTGSNGCTATSSVLVGVNKTPPTANAGTSPSLTCTTPSATIGTSSVAGNTYSWLPSTALSSTTISNPTTSATTSTTYTVTVTGSNGCTATSSVLVGVNKTPPTANAGTSPSLTCTTPSATIGTNSVAGNIYSWSPVTALSSTSISNPTTTATTSTTYTVTVTGSNGCTATSSVLVGVNKTPPTANAGTSPSLTCTTPSATLGTTSVAGNSYSWFPVTALSSSTISNPTTSATTSTTYTVTVTGSNGCTATSSVIVGVNKTPPTANAGTSPSLTCTLLSATLGTTSVAGNTYSWSPVTALSSSTISNPTTSATSSTTYTVTVTGSNGCTATSSVLVGVNKTPPTANAGTSPSLTCTTPSATLGTSSVAGNTYSWSPVTALSSTSISNPTTSVSTSTTYTVTVTGSNGCTATSSVIVGVNKNPPTANAGTSPSLTCTIPSATLGTSSVAGNTYSWSPVTALSSSTISNPTTSATSSTTYTVTVTGSNGCTATSSVLVGVNNTPPTANAGTSPSLTCTTPSAGIGTSSVAGNTYSWSPVTALSSTSISNPTTSVSTSTTYTVTVTGSNGCTATSSVLVGVNNTPPTANAGTSPSLTCTTPSAVIGTTNVAGNTYSWSPVTALSSSTISNPTTSASASTTYTVTVTGSNGCTATSSVLVGVNKTPPTANAGTSPSLTCTTPSAVIGTTNVAGNTYSWSPGTALSSTSISNPTTSATTSTTYTVTVTGSNGCTATSSVLVGVNKTPPTANAGTSPSLTCTTPSATIGTSSVAGNTYSWLPSTALSSTTISNPTTSATTSTTYTVTVTGSNGCTATSSVLVGVNKTPPTANAGTSPSLTCTTPSATIGTNSVAGNIYSWSPVTALSSTSISNPTTTATTSTTYTVTVTGSNGCTATSSVLVGVNKTPPTANAGTSPSLTCTTPSATLGTTSVAGNSYSWFPVTALSSSTISNPTTSATTSTTYTVTVTGSNGCTATSSVIVGVNKTPPTWHNQCGR
jgi:hypothetical protein